MCSSPTPTAQCFRPRSTSARPVFENGQLTLFSSRCAAAFISCANGQVWSATIRATPATLNNPNSYRPSQLATDGTGKWAPIATSVGHYTTGLRLIETTSIGGTYKIFSAPSVNAHWHLERSGTLPGCPSHTGFCFGLEGHPELSTPTDIFISYKDPDTGPSGHIVLSAVPD